MLRIDHSDIKKKLYRYIFFILWLTMNEFCFLSTSELFLDHINHWYIHIWYIYIRSSILLTGISLYKLAITLLIKTWNYYSFDHKRYIRSNSMIQRTITDQNKFVFDRLATFPCSHWWIQRDHLVKVQLHRNYTSTDILYWSFSGTSFICG